MLLLLLVAVTFGACKKQTTQDGQKTFKTMNGTFVNMPSVVDGMLYFDNDDQYEAYVAMLQEAVANENDDREESEILNDIENQVGFNSLRKTKR